MSNVFVLSISSSVRKNACYRTEHQNDITVCYRLSAACVSGSPLTRNSISLLTTPSKSLVSNPEKNKKTKKTSYKTICNTQLESHDSTGGSHDSTVESHDYTGGSHEYIGESHDSTVGHMTLLHVESHDCTGGSHEYTGESHDSTVGSHDSTVGSHDCTGNHLIMWESSLWEGHESRHQPRPEPRGDIAHRVAPDSLSYRGSRDKG